ncbi:aldehyde dehydrogenase [Novosphingobium lindaniclasticum]|uniref:Aldehyde dehydrogenase domain-containing protein n=1 Tax=Novosphingobium lindaniclasticum LE124 TaxID=1096930 RepID=T0HMW3_9SPHN|nr:aldehyde dehydrogenase [Novosphingobium lindaniclasticum]EQB14327.1 hypothetical protein L284_13100 [Novosphingobium lindaniclasticum LE124]
MIPTLTPMRAFEQRHPGCLYIGGTWQRPVGQAALDIVHPASGDVVARVAAAGRGDVDRAVGAAHRAFHHGPWPRLAMAERAAPLRRLAVAIRSRADEIGHAVTLEMGALLSESLAGARAAANLCDYYADLAESVPDREERAWGGGKAYVAQIPVGVVVAIVPWNAPLSLSILKLAPALAAGCTIILKTAPSTPLDALLLAECMDDAGFPEGVVSILPGDNDAGEALLRDERIDKVTFTGSTGVGQHIGAVCGSRVARQALELGGKSAAIVMRDMDAETVARRLAPASMRLTGQACSALTRVLLPRQHAASYTEALVAEFAKLKVGDPYDAATSLAPLALERQRDRVEDYVSSGIAEGATLAYGGRRPEGFERGWYHEPTIFARVSNSMRIAREEIFGPVVSLIEYDGEEEAIAIANDSDYGLYASVYSDDEDAVCRLAGRLRVGNVSRAGLYIDRTLPYGGLKKSGVSREGGIEGLRSFQEVQTIYLPAT